MLYGGKMKKISIFLILLISTALFAENNHSLINDLKQKVSVRKRYRAIKTLSKKQYVPVLSYFVEIMTTSSEQQSESPGRVLGMRTVISKNLSYYAGIEYKKIKSFISEFLVYLENSKNIETDSVLIMSLALIINKSNVEHHKLALIKRIRSMIMEVRRKSRTNAYYREQEEIVVRRVLVALSGIKHSKTLALLKEMSAMNFKRKYNRRIYEIISKNYS